MGDLRSLLISTTVLVIIILFNQSKNKFLKSSSILVGLVSGYLISYFLGMIDVTPVMESGWFHYLSPLHINGHLNQLLL